MNEKLFKGTVSTRHSLRFKNTDPMCLREEEAGRNSIPLQTIRKKVEPIVGKEAQRKYLGFDGKREEAPGYKELLKQRCEDGLKV